MALHTTETVEQAQAGAEPRSDEETPRGTMFVLLVYAAVLAVLWGYSYVSLLLRR